MSKVHLISPIRNKSEYENFLVRRAEFSTGQDILDSRMAKKIKIGDVLQILTSRGIAYAQVTHNNDEFGFLVRIFPGFCSDIPDDLGGISQQDPQFSTFFPVQAAINQGLLSVVGNTPVSERNGVFPTFRSASRGKNGERGPWWLWDGTAPIRLERPLTSQERTFPIKAIISAPLLVERIENGYRAETHDV